MLIESANFNLDATWVLRYTGGLDETVPITANSDERGAIVLSMPWRFSYLEIKLVDFDRVKREFTATYFEGISGTSASIIFKQAKNGQLTGKVPGPGPTQFWTIEKA